MHTLVLLAGLACVVLVVLLARRATERYEADRVSEDTRAHLFDDDEPPIR